jgi:hypothetical protein
MKKPLLVERFADNGEHSHWALVEPEDGRLIWSEAPGEEIQKVYKEPDDNTPGFKDFSDRLVNKVNEAQEFLDSLTNPKVPISPEEILKKYPKACSCDEQGRKEQLILAMKEFAGLKEIKLPEERKILNYESDWMAGQADGWNTCLVEVKFLNKID